MNKVLILTTHFPPSAHVGAKRVAKFCKYLPQFGWLPEVITRKIDLSPSFDKTLLNDLPREIKVHRVGPEAKPAGKSSKTGAKPARQGLLKRFLIRVYDFVFFYDYAWIIQSYKQARQVVKRKEVKTVFVTFPNVEPLLVGLMLKIFCRVKLIVEFRDPWTLLHVNYNIPLSQKLVERFLERRLFRQADQLVTIGESMAELLSKGQGRSRDKDISVIHNGFDPDDYSALNKKRANDRFTLTYLGIWSNKRTPEFFLQALAELLSVNGEMRDNIIVNFVGGVRSDPQLESKIRKLIEEGQLQNIVRLVPHLPRQEGASLLAVSDVLLLISRPSQPETDNHWVITTKLFEYLYIGKPILAMVPPAGDAAKIVGRARAGQVVEPTDVVGIQEALSQFYGRFLCGACDFDPDTDYISRFTRKNQARRLAGIFDEVRAE